MGRKKKYLTDEEKKQSQRNHQMNHYWKNAKRLRIDALNRYYNNKKRNNNEKNVPNDKNP